MSYRDVFDVFKRERKLNDDETAFLNSLRHMTDAEREQLAETLNPFPAKAAAKTAGRQRKIEHCEVCDYTRRALLHKDPNVGDYHEFVPRSSSKPKSARASSLAEKLQQKPLGQGVKADEYEDGAESCAKCGEDGDNNVHHKRTNPNYHPFVPAASSADESSSPTSESSKGGQSSTPSSEVETASASSATGGPNGGD